MTTSDKRFLCINIGNIHISIASLCVVMPYRNQNIYKSPFFFFYYGDVTVTGVIADISGSVENGFHTDHF